MKRTIKIEASDPKAGMTVDELIEAVSGLATVGSHPTVEITFKGRIKAIKIEVDQ